MTEEGSASEKKKFVKTNFLAKTSKNLFLLKGKIFKMPARNNNKIFAGFGTPPPLKGAGASFRSRCWRILPARLQASGQGVKVLLFQIPFLGFVNKIW